MELEIINLVLDYSVNGIIADANFINKVIEIVVNGKSIGEYVHTVGFTDKLDNGVLATYNFSKRRILIGYEFIPAFIEEYNRCDNLFTKLEQIMLRNLVITQIILHELEHASQNKKVDNVLDDSIETKLLRVSLTLQRIINNPNFSERLLDGSISLEEFSAFVFQNVQLSEKYYQLDPLERLAQINSFKTLLSSIYLVKDDVPNLYKFEYASLVGAMLDGYKESFKEGSCPTEVYLSKTGHEKMWREFDFYDSKFKRLLNNVSDEYSLDMRLSLGLPISKSEFKKANRF